MTGCALTEDKKTSFSSFAAAPAAHYGTGTLTCVYRITKGIPAGSLLKVEGMMACNRPGTPQSG